MGWKPLLRMFRRFLKCDILPKSVYSKLRKVQMKDRQAMIVKELNLPDEILALEESGPACFIMVSSHNLVSRKKLLPQYHYLFEKGKVDELWKNYFTIFQDNNSLERISFFIKPLIKHLWARFCQSLRAQILAYINRIRTENES